MRPIMLTGRIKAMLRQKSLKIFLLKFNFAVIVFVSALKKVIPFVGHVDRTIKKQCSQN